MLAEIVGKPRRRQGLAPNLADYAAECAGFSWDAVRARPGGGLNIAHEALDRHVAAGHGTRPALIWIAKDGRRTAFTYADLTAETARFAEVLASLGVGRGDRIFGLAGRMPGLYVAALGTLKAGAVFAPLFSAFGPEPIRARLEIGDAKVLVTTDALYRRKLKDWIHEVDGLDHVLLIDTDAPRGPRTRPLAPLMAEAPGTTPAAATAPEDMALLHFTSGTTGKPKGVAHVHDAVVHPWPAPATPSTCTPTTSSGARPTRAG